MMHAKLHDGGLRTWKSDSATQPVAMHSARVEFALDNVLNECNIITHHRAGTDASRHPSQYGGDIPAISVGSRSAGRGNDAGLGSWTSHGTYATVNRLYRSRLDLACMLAHGT